MDIVAYDQTHLRPIVELSLRAWAPVFVSIRESMEEAVYDALIGDWRTMQQKAVEDVCTGGEATVWVAVDDEAVAGFVAVNLHQDDNMGEIYMIAVDPDFQRRGIANALAEFSTNWMREQGMTTAMVETGEDPGHGPARAAYEKAGFRKWPVARYFKKL